VSLNPEVDADIAALIAVSAALSISGVPSIALSALHAWATSTASTC